MANISGIQLDRFFVLRKNSNIDEFYTIEDALKAGLGEIIIIDKFKEFFSPPSGFAWRISDFVFIDGDKNSYKLASDGWNIQSIDTTYKSSSRIAFNVVISDPTRKIKRILQESNVGRSHDNVRAPLKTQKSL
jgi:hypothetical protein